MATNTFNSIASLQIALRSASAYTRLPVGFSQAPDPNSDPKLTNYGHGLLYGTKTISGWVRDASSVPKKRRMMLHLWPSMEVIAVQDSDPSNGGNNYFFNELRVPTGDQHFCITVHDIDQAYMAYARDNLTPV